MKVVLLIDVGTDIEVEIIEGSRVIFVLRGQMGQQPVRIRSPASKNKGSFILYDRALDVETAGQQSDTGRAGDILFIPFPAVDIQHGGQTTAEPGGNAALVEFHVF